MRIPLRLQRWFAKIPGPQCRICVCCRHRVGRFLPYRSGAAALPPLLQHLDCVGSDLDHHACPVCGSHDRERHQVFFLRAMRLPERMPNLRILHFAPERQLSALIRGHAPKTYLRCDLIPSEPGIESVDIQDMPFADQSFDLVIANHVLEHVDDDLQAVREVRRVLRAGGLAILQTPYCAGLAKTWSDPAIKSPQARLQAYGQEDHVRLYGRDVFDRITSFGLKSAVRSHEELLPSIDARRNGVNPREPFFLFRRED